MSWHACINSTLTHEVFTIIPLATRTCLPTHDKLLVKGWLQVRRVFEHPASRGWGSGCSGWQGGCYRGFCQNSPPHCLCECFSVVSGGGIWGVAQLLSVRLKTVEKFKAGGDSWTGVCWLSVADVIEGPGGQRVVTACSYHGDSLFQQLEWFAATEGPTRGGWGRC